MNSEPLELLAVGEFVSVSVGFVWAPYSEALRDARTASLVDEIRAKVEGAEILDAGTSRVRLAWTVADVRALRVGLRRA